MNKEIKILIADDHPIMRQGIRFLLEKENNLKVIAEAGDGEEAYSLIINSDFDIATLDVEMPKMSGLEIARKIYKEKIKIKIIFLTMYKDEDMFNQAMDIGAYGYILKENAVNDIVDCIKAVAENKYYISPEISQYLVKREQRRNNFIAGIPSVESLTKTEKLILKLISEEKTSKEIADKLFISYKTVENHRNNISKKLNLSGSHSLIKFALTHKSSL